MKWTNYYCDPNNGAPKDVSYSDTDVPLFRVAEAYLTLAEATFRLEGPSAKGFGIEEGESRQARDF